MVTKDAQSKRVDTRTCLLIWN